MRAETVTRQPPTEETSLPLRADTLGRICRGALASLWRAWRGRELGDVAPDMSLRDDGLGLDSLEMLELVTELNRRFGLHRTGIEDYLLIDPTLDRWGELLAEHLRLLGAEADITFSTSGSEGDPEHVAHGVARLMAEVAALSRDLLDPSSTGQTRPRNVRARGGAPRPLDPTGRVVSLVPPQHIFGFLFSALWPDATGTPVADLSHAGPGRLLATLKLGDVIVATPHHLSLALDAHARPDLPDGVAAIVSGAAAPAALWRRAGDLGLRMVEVYGATQTGGIGWRTEAEAPFRLLSHVARRSDGLFVKGQALALQDEVTWDDARHFTLGARRDRIVQVAGVNVSLSSVRNALLACAGCADVAVRLDTERGRLKAFVVPSDAGADASVLEAELRTEIARSLTAAARPQSYRFGPNLPRGPSGKLTDW